MDGRLTSALASFRARYPGDASHKRLEGWLCDHAPEERRAAKALAAFVKLDLHTEVAKLPARSTRSRFAASWTP